MPAVIAKLCFNGTLDYDNGEYCLNNDKHRKGHKTATS